MRGVTEILWERPFSRMEGWRKVSYKEFKDDLHPIDTEGRMVVGQLERTLREGRKG